MAIDVPAINYELPMGLVDTSKLPSQNGFTTSPAIWQSYIPETDTLNIGINPMFENETASMYTNNRGGLFGLSNDTLSGIGLGLQGLSGLASAYLGYKNYQLAQDQFKFQKGLANRNLANQAKMINNTYDNAAQVAAGMVGSKDNSGRYGFTRQDIIDSYANNAKQKYVNGSPIG